MRGDRDDARATARRLAEIGTVLGLVFAVLLPPGGTSIPALFTDELPVVDQAHVAWPWFIATLPLSGLLFALDGILIGAGDIAFMRNVTLAGALGGFLPLTIAAVRASTGASAASGPVCWRSS